MEYIYIHRYTHIYLFDQIDVICLTILDVKVGFYVDRI